MDNTEQKPIFVMKRKKSFMITLYYIFATLWYLATALVCFGLLFNDNITFNIIGFVLLVFTPSNYLDTIGTKEVICYEDYFIIKRMVFSKKNYYNNINTNTQYIVE